LIGRTLGHYRLTAKLGAGGMGEVFRAVDTKLGRDVAVKILPAEMASDPERLERFRREAKVLATLDHAAIVSVFSIEEVDGIHFLTMQLVDGETLDRLTPAEGLPLERFFELALPLADGLAAAHERGVIHRDLKPGNVMVAETGGIKILDFGLARIARSPESVDSELPTDVQTREGVVMGTVPYMSPEQVSGRSVDHRSDVFSLGIVLYEMACGRRPFSGNSAAELASAILRDQPAPLSEFRNDLPEGLSNLIDRCLEKKADDRFQTVREVHAALRAGREEPSRSRSGEVQVQEGFWVAVLPFKHRGSEPDLEALAEGLSEDIVTGLSRFSYLRVISRSSTLKYRDESYDVRSVGKDLGARYILEGSLRKAGSQLRVATQLVDATSSAHLWAETYNRTFRSDGIFELQDELVPKIVSTVADSHGVLPRTMSASLRGRSPSELTPYEAVMRSFGYMERLDAEEHAEVRACLTQALEKAPKDADCLANLSISFAEEFKHGFNAGPDPLGRALEAARAAVLAAPSNHLAYLALAQTLFFRRELREFRNAAERAIALNPMDGHTKAFMGILMAYAGDWDHGVALTEEALTMNPHHPGWYRFGAFFHAFRKGDYRAALDVAEKLNMPSYFYTHAALAAVYGQLGHRESARKALADLLRLMPDFARGARDEWTKWLGEGELVDRMVEGLRKAGLEIREASRAPSPPVAIAILPFQDMSPSKDQEYLGDGLAEEIIFTLARIPSLRVVARTSAFSFKGTSTDVREIGRKLGVSSVLEGSVRTSENRIRITAQLVDAESGYELWSERFDRELQDVFAIQDEITRAVVEKLKVELLGERKDEILRRATVDPAVFALVLEGRFHSYRYTLKDLEQAVRCFEKAIDVAPDYAPAHAGLAFTLMWMGGAGPMDHLYPDEAYPRARTALERALALDPRSSEAHVSHGILLAAYERDWAASERAFERGLELNPGNADAHMWFAWYWWLRRRLDATTTRLRTALALDPLSPIVASFEALVLYCERRYDEARSAFERLLEVDPEFLHAHMHLGDVHLTVGNLDRAEECYDRALSLTGGSSSYIRAQLVGIYQATSRVEAAERRMRELLARSEEKYVPAAWIALAYLGLGKIDETFTWLDKALGERNALAPPWANFPWSDPVRSDPRFAEFVKKLG
jgi:TolB-like protein/Tfp pilus assembly protein PilF